MSDHSEKPNHNAQAKACCYYCVGVFFFVIGILALVIYVLFTPIYKPVTCEASGGMLSGLNVPGLGSLEKQVSLLNNLPFLHGASNAGAAAQVNITCSNPNPISVDIHDLLGTIYIGPDKTKVGIVDIRNSLLPAYGSGIISTNNTVVLDPALANRVLPRMLIGKGVPMQFDVAATATASLFGISVTPTIRLRCGMMLASATDMLLDPHGSVMGPMSCSDSDDLNIPDKHAEIDADSEKDSARVESIKTLMLVASMIIGFTSGPFFMYHGFRSQGLCSRSWQQAREAALGAPGSEQTGKDEKPDVDEHDYPV